MHVKEIVSIRALIQVNNVFPYSIGFWNINSFIYSLIF